MNAFYLLNKIQKGQRLFLALAALAFLLSLFACLSAGMGVRRAFRFESVDTGRANVEWRSLSKRPGAERYSLYVEELLLGPKTERSRPLFSPGTKAEFCFERGRTLYVGLSSVLLEKSGNASEIMDGIALFKRNVRRAFPRLKKVELYIDKKPLAEE